MEASICRIVVTVFLASSIMSFFSFVTVRRWLLSASDRAWNSYSAISVSITDKLVWRKQSHFCLARLALMVWHADFIKDSVQLVDAAVDLLREVAGVHGEQDQPPQAA